MRRVLCMFALLFCTSTARADAREISLGAFGAWEIVDGGRGGGGAEFGLTDFLALRGELSGGAIAQAGSFQLLAGPAFVWDVIDWVPATTLMVGGEFGDAPTFMGLARLEVRRFVARKTWLSLGVGGEVHRNDLQPHVMLSAFWVL